MVVFPNAKINIGLNIVAKRNDGFHNIESIFYPVEDLYDVLEIVESNKLIFNTTGVKIPDDSTNNLCLKAFHILQNDFNIAPVNIHLHKVIPIGAGLGGGSADAAFTLKTLNDIFQLNLSISKLQDYARKLGSDCAFFIENKPVYAFNKGDEFEKIDLDLSSHEIKIEYPNIHISTAEAYAGIVPQPSHKKLKELISSPIEEWKHHIKNDFETSIFPNHPAIENVKNNMYKNGAKFASMTGSGSAVFGIF